ncbi:MAG: glycoside hydrolase [Treponema sp.]|jgi:spore germination protein YaaH|nr:glycoside hydrolase [Treponema sp.]
MRYQYFKIIISFFIILASCNTSKTRQTPETEPAPGTPETAVLADAGKAASGETAGASPAAEPPVEAADPVAAAYPQSSFGEIWAYLIAGQEETLKAAYPLSDIGYFGAEVDLYGKLTGVPNPQKIAFYKGRVHLVAACSGRALSHFVLEPESAVRKQLVADLLESSKTFDGLQIDFENIPGRDGDRFLSFLRELRNGLADKRFTIALPARTKTIANDVFDYKKILPLVDRILVMAYDEHWSTSAPGPIASMGWCRNVAAYSLATIGKEKLIMGLPFYGRTWGNINPNRAFFHSGIQRIIAENRITGIRREHDIPTFQYETSVKITAYYEDAHSLSKRLEMYRIMGVQSVGFWRLGQETPDVWNIARLTGQAP